MKVFIVIGESLEELENKTNEKLQSLGKIKNIQFAVDEYVYINQITYKEV